MLWVQKCHNLSVCGGGGIFPYQSEYFSHAKKLKLLYLRSLIQVTMFRVTTGCGSESPADQPKINFFWKRR